MMSGSSGGGSGGGGSVFIPPGQAGVASALGSTMQPLIDLSANAGAGTPAGQAYPQASSFVSNFLTGGTDPSQTPFNDLLTRAFQPSYTAADYGANTLFPRGAAQGDVLNALGQGAVGSAQTALTQGFDPAYGNVVSGAQNNPYTTQAIGGALQGAGLGATGADAIQSAAATQAGQVPFFGGLSQSVSNLMTPVEQQAALTAGLRSPVEQQAALTAGLRSPVEQQAALTAGLRSPVEQQAAKIGSTVGPLIQSGFDPQSALFNRSRQQLMDQTSAVNAMSGLDRTPYGASVTANALGNFDTNWQNSQLARQESAAGAAGQAAGQAGSLYGTSGSLGTQAGNLYGTSGQLGTQAGNLYGTSGQLGGQAGSLYGTSGQLGGQAGSLLGQGGQAADRSSLLYGMAPGLATSSAAAPSQAYGNSLQQIISALSARNQGATSGLSNYASGLGSATSGFQGGQNAGAQGAQYASQFGAAPYNLGTGVASNALSGLTNQANLGNNQFALPESVAGNLMKYLGLGQSASTAAGNLANQQFNQTAQGIGGGLSAASQLFGGGGGGSGGLFGGGGLGSSLLGSSPLSLTGQAAGSPFLIPGTDAVLPSIATADAVGGGSGILGSLGSLALSI